MQPLGTVRQVIRFEPFEFDALAWELRRDGFRVKLQGQPFLILALLLRVPGALVTREQLRQALWPVDTFVDFENGLNRAISKLREALGDSRLKPRYIETVARHGYRFLAGTQVVAPTADAHRAVRLAVLPFANLSGDSAQDCLSDGLTDEMTAQLAQLHPRRLKVIARPSAMHCKETQKTAAQIGRELQADCILEGSMRRSAEHVRVTVLLIAVEDQAYLWSETYDCEFKNTLAMQSDIASRVRNSLAALFCFPESRKAPVSGRSEASA